MTSEPSTIKAIKSTPCTVGTVGELVALLQKLDPSLQVVATAEDKRHAFLEIREIKAHLAGHDIPVDLYVQLDLQCPGP